MQRNESPVFLNPQRSCLAFLPQISLAVFGGESNRVQHLAAGGNRRHVVGRGRCVIAGARHVVNRFGFPVAGRVEWIERVGGEIHARLHHRRIVAGVKEHAHRIVEVNARACLAGKLLKFVAQPFAVGRENSAAPKLRIFHEPQIAVGREGQTFHIAERVRLIRNLRRRTPTCDAEAREDFACGGILDDLLAFAPQRNIQIPRAVARDGVGFVQSLK